MLYIFETNLHKQERHKKRHKKWMKWRLSILPDSGKCDLRIIHATSLAQSSENFKNWTISEISAS